MNGIIRNGGVLRRRPSTASESGLAAIDLVWRTRRHKGSCRALAMSHDGSVLYSAGEEGILKAADTETGRVVSKVRIAPSSMVGRRISAAPDGDGPTVLHSLSPMNLLVGSDTGALGVYDVRDKAQAVQGRPVRLFEDVQGHGEHVAAIAPLPPGEKSTSGFPHTWCCVGGVTVAVVDLRKGVVAQSEEQEEELTTGVFVGGLRKGAGSTSVGEKLVVGTGSGVLGLWERGVWDDLDERVLADGHGRSAVEGLSVVPDDISTQLMGQRMNEKVVALGLEDGRVRFVKMGPNKVMAEMDVWHDAVDGAVGIGFDVTGRMVTGGGQVVKVWTEAQNDEGGRTVDDDTSEDSDEEDEDDSSSDEEIADRRDGKRRKLNHGNSRTGGGAINITGLG